MEDTEAGDERIGDGVGPSSDLGQENNRNVYRDFQASWSKGDGFHLVEGTVGCSARYRSEPLLWAYPTYFQIAPRGAGSS